MHKYHAVPSVVDNIRFDSKAEARRFEELKLLQKAGAIKRFQLQPSFILLDAYTKPNGEKVRPIIYKADFEVFYPDHVEIEDVKGVETPIFKLKRKMFEKRYPDKKLVLV